MLNFDAPALTAKAFGHGLDNAANAAAIIGGKPWSAEPASPALRLPEELPNLPGEAAVPEEMAEARAGLQEAIAETSRENGRL
jgi:hypothetical protein